MLSTPVICMTIVALQLFASGGCITWIAIKEFYYTIMYRLPGTMAFDWVFLILTFVVGILMLWGGYMIFPYIFALGVV